MSVCLRLKTLGEDGMHTFVHYIYIYILPQQHCPLLVFSLLKVLWKPVLKTLLVTVIQPKGQQLVSTSMKWEVDQKRLYI